VGGLNDNTLSSLRGERGWEEWASMGDYAFAAWGEGVGGMGFDSLAS
jgi:hypothetical protein